MNRLYATTRSCHRALIRQKEEEKKNSAKYLNSISIICLCTAYIFRCCYCCCYSISSMSHHEAPDSLMSQPLYATMCAWCPFIFLLTLDVFFFVCYAFIDGGDGDCCWASFCLNSACGTVCINTVRLWGHFVRYTNVRKHFKILETYCDTVIESFYA